MPHPVTARHRGRLIALAAALTAALAVGITATALAAVPARAAVDGVSFSDAELALSAARAERAGHDADDPAAQIDVLRDDLALFAVARSLGATDVTRPDDILGVLDDANAQRAAISDDGGVLYGPVTYAAAAFYGKSLSDIRQATLSRLESGPDGGGVSDADVRARFDADPAQWADAATTSHLTRLAVPTGSDGGPDPVIAAALRAGDGASALGAAAGQSLDLTAEQIAAATLSPDATAAVLAAPVGAVVGPFAEQGGWVAYRLDGRSVDEAAAFAHYAGRIRSALLDERLDALIADARSAQSVDSP